MDIRTQQACLADFVRIVAIDQAQKSDLDTDAKEGLIGLLEGTIRTDGSVLLERLGMMGPPALPPRPTHLPNVKQHQ